MKLRFCSLLEHIDEDSTTLVVYSIIKVQANIATEAAITCLAVLIYVII